MKIRLNKSVAALATGALLLVGVPVVGLSSVSSAAAKPVYVIGYQGPLTGSAAQYGLNELGGLNLAINNANATGKLPFTLKVKSYDDQGDPTLAPAQAQAEVAIPNLVAVVGAAFSGATHASMPYWTNAHIAAITPSATAVTIATGKNNFFRMVYGDDVQGTTDANFLVKTKGAKTVSVISDGSFYGAGIAGVVAGAAKAAGATVTTDSLPQTSSCSGGVASVSEFAAAATKIKTSKPDAVFYGGYACDFANLLPALKSAGYKGTVMSGDGSYDAVLLKTTTPKSAALGAYLSAANCGSTGNLTGTLAKQYKKLTGIEPAAALYDAQAYDAGNILVAALQKISLTGGVSAIRPAIISYLHSGSWSGVTGKIQFQANGDLVGTGKGNIAIYKVTGKKLPTAHSCY